MVIERRYNYDQISPIFYEFDYPEIEIQSNYIEFDNNYDESQWYFV